MVMECETIVYFKLTDPKSSLIVTGCNVDETICPIVIAFYLLWYDERSKGVVVFLDFWTFCLVLL